MPKRRQDEAFRNPAGRPAASLGRDARDSLLTSAVELFATQGVAATTFATIAQRAGLTPAMLHYYFETRDQLLDSAVEERMVPLIITVWNPIQNVDDPVGMVRGLIDRLLEGIGRMPWIPVLWIREVLNENGLLRSRVLRHVPRERVRVFCSVIAHGQEQGFVNPNIDPLLLVFSILGAVMVHSASLKFLAKMFERESLSTENLKQHITALLTDGLRFEAHSRKNSASRKRRQS